jgi:hypothetical protein
MSISKAALTLLFSAACALPAGVAFGKAVRAQAEVKLDYGLTEIRVGTMALHIVRAYVSNMTASSFDTFTIYLGPEKSGDPWQQVTVPTAKDIGFNLQNYESGDANIQTIAFYKENGQLYAVQATREGGDGPEANLKKARVEFRVYRFNQDWDVPMFVPGAVSHSKVRYQDAIDALKQEFFLP